jgi:5-methylcytosine-specific restriction endonuclease McrA
LRNYNDPEYKQFRKDVLKRDKGKCRMPNCKSKRNLHVHHIKTWANASSMRYEVYNGITLCKKCHDMVTGKEIHYENLFRELLDG